MDNCGFTEIGYKEIEDCLVINQTLKKFSSLSLIKMNEENSLTENMRLTIKKLETEVNEKMQYLEEKLESEIFQKRQSEHLVEQLHRQLIEAKKQLSIQEKNQIKEGYILVKEADYEKYLKEQGFCCCFKIFFFFNFSFYSRQAERQRRNKKFPNSTGRISEEHGNDLLNETGLSRVLTTRPKNTGRSTRNNPKNKKRQFFEKNIGDTIYTGRIPEEDENDLITPRPEIESDSTDLLDEIQPRIQPNFRISMKPKTRSSRVNHPPSAQSLFMGTSKNVTDSEDSSSSS